MATGNVTVNCPVDSQAVMTGKLLLILLYILFTTLLHKYMLYKCTLYTATVRHIRVTHNRGGVIIMATINGNQWQSMAMGQWGNGALVVSRNGVHSFTNIVYNIIIPLLLPLL